MTSRIKTGADMLAARAKLGHLWGLDRSLHRSELGRILRLNNRDPGETVANWEEGRSQGAAFHIAAVVVEMLLGGASPPPDSEWRRGAAP